MKRAFTTFGLALLAIAATSCRNYSASEGDAPDQPIAFYHTVHAGQDSVPCMYCHYTADRSVDAGIPAVQVCVGCHVPGSSAPGAVASQASLAFPTAQRDTFWNRNAGLLVDYWKRQQAIPWVRIHKLPEHVRFPHFMHVNAGLRCQTCHGEVQTMKKVYQFASLRMGWCIECHRGQTPLRPEEEASVQQRSSFLRHVRELAAAGNDVRGVAATRPRQRATTDCVACHY
jgi:cytochrome c7-like protein